MTRRAPTIAVVLGSGGVLGASFHAGVLLALKDAWNIDGRYVDQIVGTSAGALSGALLAGGLTPADLFRREQGSPLSPHGQRIMAKRRTKSPRTDEQTVTGVGPAAAPGLIFSALRSPGKVLPGSVMAGMAPRGRNSTAAIADTVDAVLDRSWPVSPDLDICAVELQSGRRRVFSSKRSDGQGERPTPGTAVAASCSVPMVHRPVEHDGREFVDGAAHSANNVDIVGRSHDLVIISSPMSGWNDRVSAGPWGATARLFVTAQTLIERGHLDSDTRVVMFEPNAKHLRVVGRDPMRTDRRAAVAVSSHQLALARLADETTPLFTRTKPKAQK